MRRLAGCRLGAMFSLSLVLSLGLSMGTAAGLPVSVGVEAPAAPQGGPTGPRETATAPDVDITRVGAARAKAATRVELPRPVRGATAIRLLGDRLDEAAARNDLTESELAELLRSDPTVWVDTTGDVFFKDEVAVASRVDPVSAQAPLDQTFLLHSKPGSTRTIFLDFDGGAASATAWHANFPATPTTQPAWDPSGNGPAFDDAELTAIQTVWQVVAEDYAPFDVDVTTADPGPAAIVRSSTSDQAFGSRVLVTPSDAAHEAICNPNSNGSGCGGVAYLGVFDDVAGSGGDGYGYKQPAWVFPQKLGNTAKNVAEAASHEVGHNFGLNHDANATQGYDTGHGAWAPIMGTGYTRAISQWSKGDYAGATNTEDDVALIRSVTDGRADEAGTSIAGAPVVPAGTAYVTGRTDVDTYLLGTCTGSVTVTASALAAFADLDIQLTLRDATGQVVETVDPASAQVTVDTASDMSASLTRTLAAGTYYVSVDGVGNGPWSTGYDDYGSLGAYTLDVTGTGACDGAAPAGTPTVPTNAAASAHATDPAATITWDAPTSAGSSAVTGYVLTRSGSDVAVEVGATATSHTWTGLESSTAYTFTVTALNAQGPGPSATVNATTAAGTLTPSVPQNVTASWDSLEQYAVLLYAAPASSGSYPVTAYDIFVNGVYAGQTTYLGVGITLSTSGTYTLGVAAVSQAGRGPVAEVSVVMPARPANDTFAQRTTLSGVTGTVTGDNLESSAEQSEPAPTATRADAGAASLWYSWTAPATGPVTLSTGSTDAARDTTLDVYTGTTVAGLTRVVGNDEPTSGTSHLAAVEFSATAGTTYALAVNGYRTFAAGVGPFSLTWSGTAPSPAAVTSTALASAVNGRSATLTATVTAGAGEPAGTVEFRDGEVLVGSEAVSSGTAALTVDDLVRGDHAFRATFVPTSSAVFTTSQSSVVTSTVAGTTTTTTLAAAGGVNTVDLTATVVPAAGTATGTVQFREGLTTVGGASVSGGTASLALTGVTAGDHTYTATFVPADPQRYDGSASPARSATVSAPPVAAATTTALTATSADRSATLAVTVTAASATPQGTVQLRDGATVVGTVELSGGTASLRVDDLLRGTHRFTAEFVPADATSFVASRSSESVLEIAATPTTTALTASATGRTVSLQASISPNVAGTVRFLEGATVVGTVTVASGSSQLTLTDVPAGNHTYTASFVPADDLRHAASGSDERTVTVEATPTTTVLGSSVTDHRVTLTATVTSAQGSPAGTVELREGTTLVGTSVLSAGTVTIGLDDVATGSHSYVATFVPTAPTSFAGSVSGARTVTVTATPTTTGLVATAEGRTVRLTATPGTDSGTLAGRVEFREGTTVVGDVPLGADPTVLELSSVTPGGHSYTATFVPTGTSHAGSTSPLRTVTVRVTSTTALTAAATGRDVTLDVQLTTDGGSPAGTVELRDGSALVGTRPVVAGAASLTLGEVAPGDHFYQATFVPSDPASYVGSSSSIRTVTVARIATTTDLSASASGRTVTLTATPTTSSGALTGAVEFREGTTLLGTVTLTGTSAVLAVTDVATGEHTYTAVFVPTGTAHAGSTSAPRTVSVAAIATTTALTADVSGSRVTLTATSTATSGTPAGAVELREGDEPLGTWTLDGNGVTVMQLDGVLGGSHTYTATYVPADDRFAVSAGSVGVTVALTATSIGLTTDKQGRQVVLSATIGSPVGSPAGTVSFLDGDVVVATTTVSGDTAVHTLTGVATGAHDYTATFTPTRTDRYLGASSTVRSVTLTPSTTVTTLAATAEADSVAFDVRVTSPDGAPDGVVAITEDGIQRTTAVVTAGRAVFTLPSVPTGSHTYVATFGWTAAGEQFAASSSQPVVVQVSTVAPAAATTTGLSADVVRRTVTLRADVASTGGTPGGSVQFSQDGVAVGTVPLTDGSSVITRAAVTAGGHDYTATYVPADPAAFAPSASPTRSVTVQQTVTSTSLAGSVDGSTVLLDIAVTGTDGIVPTGQVRVLSGATDVGVVQLAGGTATLVLSSVAVGTQSYRAVFEGSADLAGSTSTQLDLTVDAPPPPPAVPPSTPTTPPSTPTTSPASVTSRTTLVAPKRAKVGARPVIKVFVARGSAPAVGTVRVKVGKKTKTLTLRAGAAKLRLPRLKAGKLKITVRYAGDASTTASSASRTIKVKG